MKYTIVQLFYLRSPGGFSSPFSLAGAPHFALLPQTWRLGAGEGKPAAELPSSYYACGCLERRISLRVISVHTNVRDWTFCVPCTSNLQYYTPHFNREILIHCSVVKLRVDKMAGLNNHSWRSKRRIDLSPWFIARGPSSVQEDPRNGTVVRSRGVRERSRSLSGIKIPAACAHG